MKKHKKYISNLLALLLVFNFLIPSISLAKSSKEILEIEKVIIYDFRNNTGEETNLHSVSGAGATILVFLASYLVGKIIDGVFIVTTGKPLENHIVDFIKSTYKNNTYSGNTIRVKYGCNYAPGQPCLENPKPKYGCHYAPGQPCN